MSQYIIDIEEGKKADALIRYLKSLDFIKIKLEGQAVGKKSKVKQGTGRHLVFMSDTLFDDDLKA